MSSSTRRAALYIVLVADATATQRVQAALASPHVESVLICAPPGSRLDAASARPLVEIVQRAGVAAVIGHDAQLARTLRADGVHIAWSNSVADAFAEARELLGGRAIVGADAGTSRHDAMVLAEAGADYVSFGAAADEVSRQIRAELVAWWAEIFEVPCVALDVTDPAEAAALAHAGSDFIGLALPQGETLAESAARIANCLTAMRGGALDAAAARADRVAT